MSLVPFRYDGQPVRVVDIDGEPWFVLADLCRVLGITRPPSAVAERIDDALRRAYPIADSLGRTQQAIIVSEPGMYEVVIRSDKPDAKTFRRWITAEVLPQIRKTGRYSTEAAEHQINALIFQSRARIELLQAARGLIHPDHLEAHARCVLAIGLGEPAELPTDTRPLYAQDYLREKNLSSKRIGATAGMFGKRLKAAYIEEHGAPPAKYPLSLGNGQVREVNDTEADRLLMDTVWATYYAGERVA